MAEPQKAASLQDVINYQADNYFTEEDINVIQGTLGNNPKIFRVLQKALLPMVSDPALPVEKFSDDTFLAGRNWASIPDENVKALVVAREDAIKFICGGLIKLKVIANTPTESAQDIKNRIAKDSTQ